jgi:hypothetical protein
LIFRFSFYYYYIIIIIIIFFFLLSPPHTYYTFLFTFSFFFLFFFSPPPTYPPSLSFLFLSAEFLFLQYPDLTLHPDLNPTQTRFLFSSSLSFNSRNITPLYLLFLFSFFFFFSPTTHIPPPPFLFFSYLLSSFSFNTQISPSTLASMATILSENFRTASLDGIVDGEASSREASERRAAVRPFTYRNLVKEVVLVRHGIVDGDFSWKE